MSASYYAIFHHLSSECAKAVVGTRSAHGSVRHLVSRSFVHSDMADASKRFRAPAADLPSLVLVALANHEVHSSVKQVADAFVTLQQKRHEADYDLSTPFVRENVVAIVEHSRAAIAAWQTARATPSAHVYLLSLLLWRQIKAK